LTTGVLDHALDPILVDLSKIFHNIIRIDVPFLQTLVSPACELILIVPSNQNAQNCAPVAFFAPIMDQFLRSHFPLEQPPINSSCEKEFPVVAQKHRFDFSFVQLAKTFDSVIGIIIKGNHFDVPCLVAYDQELGLLWVNAKTAWRLLEGAFLAAPCLGAIGIWAWAIWAWGIRGIQACVFYREPIWLVFFEKNTVGLCLSYGWYSADSPSSWALP
jgi:hypothetical protein